jgi:hypothetical protein
MVFSYVIKHTLFNKFLKEFLIIGSGFLDRKFGDLHIIIVKWGTYAFIDVLIGFSRIDFNTPIIVLIPRFQRLCLLSLHLLP